MMDKYEKEKEFFDQTEGSGWNILKELSTVKSIETKFKIELTGDRYIKCLGLVLCNSIYNIKNDTQFIYLFDRWVDYHMENNIKIPNDIRFRHPFLHEISHQLPRTFNKFKHVWMTDLYKKLWETGLYKDCYGMNAKQRLSVSIESWNITDEIKEWIGKNIGVKGFSFQHGEYGKIIIPTKEQYTYSEPSDSEWC